MRIDGYMVKKEMREIDNAKQNCDHVFEGIWTTYNGEPQCANCGETLTSRQLSMIITKSLLIVEEELKERVGMKNESL